MDLILNAKQLHACWHSLSFLAKLKVGPYSEILSQTTSLHLSCAFGLLDPPIHSLLSVAAYSLVASSTLADQIYAIRQLQKVIIMPVQCSMAGVQQIERDDCSTLILNLQMVTHQNAHDKLAQYMYNYCGNEFLKRESNII